MSRSGNGFGRAWDETLTPRQRALVAFAAMTALIELVFTIGGGGVSVFGIVESASIAAFVTYILARRGKFADRVTVILAGNQGPVVTRQKIRPVLRRDRIRPLDDPSWLSAETVITAMTVETEYVPETAEILETDETPADGMAPTTRVLGLVYRGEARAYPLAALGFREAVNDTIDGVPVAVTWSPFCYAGRAFVATDADGAPVRFGSTGRMVLNSPVFYDYETGREWLQYQGASLDPGDAGAAFDEIPCVNTTLAAWTAAYPDTTVLDDPEAPAVDLFDRYYASGRAGVHGPPHRDARWPNKEVVAGVLLNGESCAFPFSWLQLEPVVHEEVGGIPVLVAFEASSASAAVFRADPGGRLLTFEPEEPPDDEAIVVPEPGVPYRPMYLRDRETGGRWSAISGMCLSGELEGTQLEPVAAVLSFWFAWTNFHPGTRLTTRPDFSRFAGTDVDDEPVVDGE